MDIISPMVNGGWLNLENVREQAAERPVAAVVEQRRDGSGQFVSYKEAPGNTAKEGVGADGIKELTEIPQGKDAAATYRFAPTPIEEKQAAEQAKAAR